MRGRRLWMKIEVHGRTVRVVVVKDKLVDDDGNHCAALYDHENRMILVLERQDESIMKQELLHELLHVCFAGHSDDALIKVLGKEYKTREEDVVSFLEPILHDLLARNKLLKIPRPPKFD